MSAQGHQESPAQRRAAALVWVQVSAVWWPWAPPSLKGLKVVKITQRRPRSPAPGCVLVKLRLTLPQAAFVAPTVEAELDAGPGQFSVVPVTAEAEQQGAAP